MIAFLLIGAIGVILIVWFIYASRPLNSIEADECARRKRLLAIEAQYAFSLEQSEVNQSFKSSMEATGKLYLMDEQIEQFPSIASGLLKWKKHEWIIFAFSRGRQIIAAWMNKGPDNKRVWPLLDHKSLVEIAKELNADTVLEFHNHPNPDPNRRSMFLPSRQDHKSATYLGLQLVTSGINFLAFVSERGRHYQYGCWVPETFYPFNLFLAEVLSQNGVSRLSNFRLRRQYRAHSRLASLLQYEHASENLGFVRNRPVVQSASIIETGQIPSHLTESSTSPTATQNPIPMPSLTLTKVQSSNLLAVGYDPHCQLLEVEFKNRAKYQYFGVPENEYSCLMAAPSKGGYFIAHIVGRGFKYIRIS